MSKWSKSKVVGTLKKVSKEVGHSPSKKDAKDLGRYDLVKATYRYFEGWNKAKKQAGLEVYQVEESWSKEKIKDKLQKLQEKQDKILTANDLVKMGKEGYKIYNAIIRYFDNFNDAKEYSSLETLDHYPAEEIPNSAHDSTFELGYLVGVLLGDGNITDRTFRLGVCDEDFIDYFKEMCEKWLDKPCGKKSFTEGSTEEVLGKECNCRGQYRIAIHSKLGVGILKEYESKPEKVLDENEEFKIGFFKGFFDSEGNIHKNRSAIRIANSKKKLLRIVQETGNVVGLKNGYIRQQSDGVYQLVYTGKKNLYQLCENVGVIIKRKIEPHMDDHQIANRIQNFAARINNKQ